MCVPNTKRSGNRLVAVGAARLCYCGVSVWPRVLVCGEEQPVEGLSVEHAAGGVAGLLRVGLCVDVVLDEQHGRAGDRRSKNINT